MSRPRVKICGLTRREDADLAVALGADAIGLVFWDRSPRAIAIPHARAIVQTLPPFVVRVGVFVNAAPSAVRTIVADVGLDVVQLHGDEPVEAYATLPVRLIKAVTVEDGGSLAVGLELPGTVTPLVDAMDPTRRGGTGRRADWAHAAVLAARRPIILAGGLTAKNVREAVRAVRPWAIDVSSGVEEAPGVKSRDRLHAFFDAVRGIPAGGDA